MTIKAELNVDIETLVREVVDVAMVEALSKNGGKVVQEIVRHALERVGPYSKRTVLEEALEKAIVDLTRRRVASWITDHEQEVTTAVDQVVRKQLSPEFVARQVMIGLRKIKVPIHPFYPEPTDEPNDDEDEE